MLDMEEERNAAKAVDGTIAALGLDGRKTNYRKSLIVETMMRSLVNDPDKRPGDSMFISCRDKNDQRALRVMIGRIMKKDDDILELRDVFRYRIKVRDFETDGLKGVVLERTSILGNENTIKVFEGTPPSVTIKYIYDPRLDKKECDIRAFWALKIVENGWSNKRDEEGYPIPMTQDEIEVFINQQVDKFWNG
jgi:hypothetical protein